MKWLHGASFSISLRNADLNGFCDVEMLGFGVNGQERILETPSVQKAQGQDLWAERAALGS